MDFTFGGKYRLEEELAIGGCGTVFYGVHTVAGKEVAIKVEPAVAKHSPLKHESKIYKSLMGGPGVPWIIWSGKQGDYNVMVIDLLGPSLEDLFKMCNRHFSLKTVLLLADQLISRIEFIHERGLVHRDIKPANFVMGTGHAAHLVNVIDFGLAKKFRDPRTGMHIPYQQDGQHGVGTSLFASINTHLGIEASPRDDLESLSYMLIYFLRGTLPWRKLRATTVSGTWDLIRDAKRAAESTLTQNLPREFAEFHEYTRRLDFGDVPDYAGMRELFQRLGKRVGARYPDMEDPSGCADWRGFDWMVGRSHERKGRVCEACRRRDASWEGRA
ncbi:kinase-like protein [Vararia minispora EC-137]|uniref:Kinase-like protein n=1 Tax=Vararia minispora EC-137 TaxID=1314806 RepID=A0ACB8QHF7_9AGAM|nr:kinase-like protein [Vararia minispora EC-137]